MEVLQAVVKSKRRNKFFDVEENAPDIFVGSLDQIRIRFAFLKVGPALKRAQIIREQTDAYYPQWVGWGLNPR